MLNGPHAEAFRLTTPWDNASESTAVLDPISDLESATDFEPLLASDPVLASAPVLACDPVSGLHEIEQNIWRELQLATGGQFSSLVIRRMGDGVCLQGVLENGCESSLNEVDQLVRRVACVDRVLNQLVVREGRPN